MSEREEHDFLQDYLTWMKGPGRDRESLHVYNFGYERPLPFPSIALTPDSTMRFNLQTSGMQTPSRWSTVVIGEKYLGRFGEIMTVVDRIHEDTQALPFAIFVETEVDIKITNISFHVTDDLLFDQKEYSLRWNFEAKGVLLFDQKEYSFWSIFEAKGVLLLVHF